jgi:1,2-phenylacetyl-CoA epoxidase PaaB subunit
LTYFNSIPDKSGPDLTNKTEPKTYELLLARNKQASFLQRFTIYTATQKHALAEVRNNFF